MIIKTTYNSLVSLLNLMNLVISSNKTLQDDYKVVNLFVKNNKLYGLGTDSSLFCVNELEGEYDLEGEEILLWFFVLRKFLIFFLSIQICRELR